MLSNHAAGIVVGKIGTALPADHPLHNPTTILDQARRRLEAVLTGTA